MQRDRRGGRARAARRLDAARRTELHADAHELDELGVGALVGLLAPARSRPPTWRDLGEVAQTSRPRRAARSPGDGRRRRGHRENPGTTATAPRRARRAALRRRAAAGWNSIVRLQSAHRGVVELAQLARGRTVGAAPSGRISSQPVLERSRASRTGSRRACHAPRRHPAQRVSARARAERRRKSGCHHVTSGSAMYELTPAESSRSIVQLP